MAVPLETHPLRPVLFSLMCGLPVVQVAIIPNGTALLTRAIFNDLTDDAQFAIGVYAMCAILVGIAAGQIAVLFSDVVLHFTTKFTLGALLRKNMLAHILDRTGNDALPGSVGEAVSRFRDDVEIVSEYLMRFPFVVALTAFAGLSFFVMVRIDLLVTVAVFLPVAVVLLVATVARGRIRTYREAGRETAGEVTSFIGELLPRWSRSR